MLFQLVQDTIGAFIGEVAVHDEKGVNHAGNPEAERQNQVQDRLEWFAAEKHGERRAYNGEQVSHPGFQCIAGGGWAQERRIFHEVTQAAANPTSTPTVTSDR
jgi:hypothetical protein